MSFLRRSEHFACLHFFRRYAHVINDGRGRCNEHFDSRFRLNVFNPQSELKLNGSTATKYEFPKFRLKYSVKDVSDHRTSLGMEESKNVQVPPSFVLVFSNFLMISLAQNNVMIKDRTVHVDQVIDMFRPLKPEGIITYDLKVLEIIDKGKGILYTYNIHGRDEEDNDLFLLQKKFYQVNPDAVEKKGTKKSTKKAVEPTKKQPDQTFEFKTLPFDLERYLNPTTDDLKESTFSPTHWRQYHDITQNFKPEPICHGRYMLGVVTNQLLNYYTNGDIASLKRVQTRFTRAVFPTESLVTKSWKIGEKINFETSSKETDQLVLQGYLGFE